MICFCARRVCFAAARNLSVANLKCGAVDGGTNKPNGIEAWRINLTLFSSNISSIHEARTARWTKVAQVAPSQSEYSSMILLNPDTLAIAFVDGRGAHEQGPNCGVGCCGRDNNTIRMTRYPLTQLKTDEVVFLDFRAKPGQHDGGAADYSPQEQTAVLALQGLANRKAPHMMMNVSNVNMDAPPTGVANGQQPAMAWAQWLGREKDMKLLPMRNGGRGSGICSLVKRFDDAIKGLVLYPDRVDVHSQTPAWNGCSLATKTLATTIAGLDSLLPVTPSMLHAPCLAAMSVKVNVSAELEAAGVFAAHSSSCAVAANEWGAKHLLPRTNATAVFAVAGNAPWVWLTADYVK